MSLGQSVGRLVLARPGFVEELVDSLAGFHVTGVTGEAEVGKTTLVRAALDREPAAQAIVLDLNAAYSPNQIVWQWAHSLAAAVTSGEATLLPVTRRPERATARETRSQRVRLEERLGRRISRLIEQPGPDRGVGSLDLVNELMHATVSLSAEHAISLVIDHLEAPALSFRHPLDVSELLWSVRSAAQEAADLRIVLVARPAAVALAAGEQSAFYGDGQWLTLDRPTASEFTAATGRPMDLVADVMRYSAAHVQTTLELLELLDRSPALSLEAAASEMAGRHRTLRDRTLAHARSLHRLGGHLTVEIAHGRGPYEATRDAASKEVSVAMRQLHLAGIVRRPEEPGVDWQLTDPRVGWAITGTPPRASSW